MCPLLSCPSWVARSLLHHGLPSCRTRHLQLCRRPRWGWSQPEALPGQGHEDRPGRAAAGDPHLPGGHSGHAAAEVLALPGAAQLRPLPHQAFLHRSRRRGLGQGAGGTRGWGYGGLLPGQAMVMGRASMSAVRRGVQESRSPCPRGNPPAHSSPGLAAAPEADEPPLPDLHSPSRMLRQSPQAAFLGRLPTHQSRDLAACRSQPAGRAGMDGDVPCL